MARVIHDTLTEAGASNVTLTEHVGEQGATWLPRADYSGELRVKSASAKQAFANALMTAPALNYASAQPASADIYARIGLTTTGLTNGASAAGTVTLTGGGSGSVNTVTVNGVNIIPSGSVPFNTSLSQTATDLAAKINADLLAGLYTGVRYGAAAVGAVVTITADFRAGTLPNGYVVATTTTTITTTTANMSGGTAPTVPDSIVGFCYRMQSANTFYRVRTDPVTSKWVLEKVIAGAVTVLATAVGSPSSACGDILLTVSVLGTVHTVQIIDAVFSSNGPFTLTVTDGSITSNGAIGLWGSGGGTTSGSPPTESIAKGVLFKTSTYDFEVGSNDFAVTLPAMGLAIAGTVGTLVIAPADTPDGGVILGGSAPVADVYNTVSGG